MLVSNGVVHVIDNVLNPANSTARPDVTASAQQPAFTGASSATETPFTSGITATASAPTGGAGATATSSGPAEAGVPMQTAAVGAAALFGGAAVLANW